MLIYFIFFECKNIFNISSKAVRLELIIKAFISTILFVNIKPIKGDIVEIILFFLNQCLILILIVWSITWNENIYFDDKVISFSMLFTTKNGEYCRIKNIAQKLNIDLAFSKKYTSVNRNILYLDELAHRLDNIDVKVLKKYRLLLSIDSKENKFKVVIYNFVCLALLLIINNKADIQIGNIDGINLSINNQQKIVFLFVIILLIIVFFPMIKKVYKNFQIMKKKKLILLIIDRAIQIKENV